MASENYFGVLKKKLTTKYFIEFLMSVGLCPLSQENNLFVNFLHKASPAKTSNLLDFDQFGDFLNFKKKKISNPVIPMLFKPISRALFFLDIFPNSFSASMDILVVNSCHITL